MVDDSKVSAMNCKCGSAVVRNIADWNRQMFVTIWHGLCVRNQPVGLSLWVSQPPLPFNQIPVPPPLHLNLSCSYSGYSTHSPVKTYYLPAKFLHIILFCTTWQSHVKHCIATFSVSSLSFLLLWWFVGCSSQSSTRGYHIFILLCFHVAQLHYHQHHHSFCSLIQQDLA